MIMALYMSYEPVKKLGSIQNQIKQALASIQRIDDILDVDEAIKDASNPITTPISGNIEFKDVCYFYDNSNAKNKPAIRNLNLSIKAGEIIALVGPSGAGKTTLAGLLPRFFDPSSGRIKLDGVNLTDYSLKHLRESVALVPQKPFLFNLSVLENIELGHSAYSNKTVTESVNLANASDFIDLLPEKLDQNLGENGNRLSGGQIQRLAMARAFYKNSPILILDEATSALDSQNEETIHDSMKKLMKGKTTFLIAHRFSSIKLATRILVLNFGKVIADGSHDHVYSTCDLYKSLYDRQNIV